MLEFILFRYLMLKSNFTYRLLGVMFARLVNNIISEKI